MMSFHFHQFTCTLLPILFVLDLFNAVGVKMAVTNHLVTKPPRPCPLDPSGLLLCQSGQLSTGAMNLTGTIPIRCPTS